MNWLYIITMAYIVVSALRGFHKGFLKVVYSMAALLITVAFVAIAVPAINWAVREYTPIASYIEAGCKEYTENFIKEGLADGSLDEKLENSLGLQWMMVPKALRKELLHNVEIAGNGAGSQLVNKLVDKAAETMASFLISAAAFFLALIVIRLILFFVGRKLDLFAKVPGVHLVNMILGFCAGIVKAFIVIWTVFLLIKVTAIFPASASLIKMIEESDVLRQLYEHNRLLELLQGISFVKI